MEINNSDKCLYTLQKAYQAIPVPDALYARVVDAVRQAKEEQQNRRKKKYRGYWIKAVRSTGAAVALFMLTVTVLANSSRTIAQAMEQLPVLGALTKVVTFRTYEDDRGNVSAHIDIPQVEGGDEVNAAIQEYTDTIIAQYEQDAKVSGEEGHYALDLTYEVVTDNDSVFALRFNQTLVMASGNESVRIYNVDKATGRILSLSDLFQPDSLYLDILTQNIQEQMRWQMEADENIHYWLDDEVEEWNFTRLPDDTSFYIDQDGQLVIVFNEGDVAPMYMGVVEFTIPAEVTEPIALPDFLPPQK